jgi:hypothetical protein
MWHDTLFPKRGGHREVRVMVASPSSRPCAPGDPDVEGRWTSRGITSVVFWTLERGVDATSLILIPFTRL